MTEAYGVLVERARERQRRLASKPRIRVGTAICGQAAGALEVLEVLRNEVFQIKTARIKQLYQRMKSARGDEEANQTLLELMAFRRNIAAWKHKRTSLGAQPSG